MQATVTFQCTWMDADNNGQHPQPITVQCPYTVVQQGEIPIPAGTPSGTEFDLTLPGFAIGATLLVIENKSGQELNRAWQGNWSAHLPNGGITIEAYPVQSAAGNITGLRFMLTRDQVTAGNIVYLALGA